MRRHWALKGLAVVFLAAAALAVFGFIIKDLWNWLMPALFGWRMITYWQGLGLLVFCKILFGGIHRHGGHRGRWRGRMSERWERMTPEEREQFRTGMRGCGGRFGGRHAAGNGPTATPTAAV